MPEAVLRRSRPYILAGGTHEQLEQGVENPAHRSMVREYLKMGKDEYLYTAGRLRRSSGVRFGVRVIAKKCLFAVNHSSEKFAL